MQNTFLRLPFNELVHIFSFLPEQEFFGLSRVGMRFHNIARESPLNFAVYRLKDIYLMVQTIEQPANQANENSENFKKKVTPSTSPVNYCQMLSRNSEKISKIYKLPTNLVFKDLQGGIVNPPVVVLSGENEKRATLGVFKAQIGNESTATVRLKALEKIKLNGFIHLPTIFKNHEDQHLTKIENVFFYFIQFLQPDSSSIVFEQFLRLTGDFHHLTKEIPPSNQLKSAKLDEYRSRSSNFLDPWFQTYDSMFQDTSWKVIVKLSQYCHSEGFRCIYQNLPTQLIHGDNNQTNILLSNQIPYFIDFDSLRIDVRLLDIASYFRFGGFDQYISLTKSGELLSYINATYGTNAGKLTKDEEIYFHWIVAFSHIEFLAWAMGVLKKAVLQENHNKAKEFYTYISGYKKQMREIVEILQKPTKALFSEKESLLIKSSQPDLIIKKRTSITELSKEVKNEKQAITDCKRSIKSIWQRIVDIAKRVFYLFVQPIKTAKEKIANIFSNYFKAKNHHLEAVK